jgi:transcriptional regulator GlxA family with amidase domain
MSPTIVNPRNVAILVFDDVEVLDFAGPHEVFTVAGDIIRPAPFYVYEVGSTGSPVLARGRLLVSPRYSIDDCPDPDILVVPGGMGTRPLLKDERLLAWLAGRLPRVELMLSVCTGALLLAKAGLLAGLEATTHHSAFDHLAALSPDTRIVRDARFVESSDRIITSGGISAGIDMSLAVVERLLGEAALSMVVEEMEYGGDWRKA